MQNKSKNTVMLVIDQATEVSGWSKFINAKYKESSTINLEKEDKEIKFEKMCVSLIDLMKQNIPDFIIFEDVALQTNPATLILLSQLQGIIIGYCILNNIPFYIYKPSEWRKQLNFQMGRGTKRDQLKIQAVNYIKEKLFIDVGEDEAESICMGLAYIEMINRLTNK